MAKTKKLRAPAASALLAICAALCVVMASACGLLGDDIDSIRTRAADGKTVTVPGANLTEKLQWLRDYAYSDGSYLVEVNADEKIEYPLYELNYDNRSNITITLRGIGANRTIDNSFYLVNYVTLILDNYITIQGSIDSRRNYGSTANSTLVMNSGTAIIGGGVDVDTFIMNGGKISGNEGGGVSASNFTMNGGKISGNTISSTSNNKGGGVYIYGGSTFTMNGGEISGNTVSSTSNNKGGGVYIYGGTFTMNGGKISGNTVTTPSGYSSYGGGVCVTIAENRADRENPFVGTFTMNGGEISGNTAASSSAYGGGVYVEGGTFTMSGTAKISENTATSDYTAYGGGVYVGQGALSRYDSTTQKDIYYYRNNGTFTMSGGEISGNTASASSSTYGGGVYVDGSSSFTKTGGVIYGSNGGVNKNTGFGEAAYWNKSQNEIYCRFTTLGAGDNISTDNPDAGWNDISTFQITTAAEWNVAHSYISNSGSGTAENPKSYTLTISGNVAIPGSGFSPAIDYIAVTLNGNGTLSLSSNGSILRVGNNKTLIIDSAYLTLQGRNRNDSSLVEVYGGTLELKNGTITGNTSRGVYVRDNGTFTMNGGTISSNTSYAYGGGVYVYNGTFTKTGGTITGYASNTVNGNVVKDSSGNVMSNQGHAVYVYSAFNSKRKETTAGPGVNLSFDYNDGSPTWSGAWDE